MSTATEREILDLEERLKQADIVSDPEFLDEVLIDGFYFTGPGAVIYTKEQVLEAHRPAGVQKFSRLETSDIRIQDFGDTVIVTLRLDMTAQDHDYAFRYTRVWLKRDGRWRVVAGSAVPFELEHAH
jgi:uncharacterized protein (TIGR02246 family)